MAEKSMDDKRSFKRVPFIIDVTVEVDNEAIRYEKSQDLSMSGVFICCESPLPLGKKGKIRINLEFGEQRIPIEASFEVTRHQESDGPDTPAGMGLQFIDIDMDSSIELFNIIKYQGC